MLWAIAFATPFFLFFGWLSDKVGRKWIMLLGMLGGILFYRPIFATFLKDSDVKVWQQSSLETIKEDIKISAHNEDSVLRVSTVYRSADGAEFTRIVIDTLKGKQPDVTEIVKANSAATYANKHLPTNTYWKFVLLVWVMIIFVTMVYGPVAAFLVEMFPTRIRYTSMSLPYHIGNGVFGGLVPFIGLLLTTVYPGDPLMGLWYPIGVAALCFVIGSVYLSNRIDSEVDD